MSSSITGKPNPFQKSNPFQLQQSFQPVSSSSYGSLQPKQPYRSFQPAIDSFTQKQNSFSKQFRPQQQMWKFHEDNCGKVNVFNQQSYSRVGQKSMSQKNSFQKQLVLSNVNKKPHQVVVQESCIDRFEKVSNPFARKYLLGGGKLVESQVYNGQENIIQYEKYRAEYESYTSIKPVEYDNYRYNNYIAPSVGEVYSANQPLASVPGSSNNLQTSLHQKYDNQYGSRKSIQRDDPYRPGSFSNIQNPAVQSRFSIQRQRQRFNNNQYSSNHNINLPPQPSNKYLPIQRAERDDGMKSTFKNQKGQNGSRVRFDESDQQRQPSRYQPRQSSQKPPRFGSIKQIPQLQGPETITIHGMKFYKQNVKCF